MPSVNLQSFAATDFTARRITHWNKVAKTFSARSPFATAYHRRVEDLYRQLVQPGWRILELGCGNGDLLAALEPMHGIGIDFSPEMVALAKERHPSLDVRVQDVHNLDVEGEFDAIILSDLVNDLWDVQAVLKGIHTHCTPRTRIIINMYSRMWELPLALARTVGLARPELQQNWLSPRDVDNILYLAGFDRIKHTQEILFPLNIQPFDSLFNKVVVKLFPFRHLALTNLIVARIEPRRMAGQSPLVSVIVPARNEAGNIESIVNRIPEMGAGTEIVFVEGHSRDDTAETIARVIASHPERRYKFLRQSGTGKGDAVRTGFEAAEGSILMILDADLTVAPEDLPRFYEALVERRGEFINGVRLVYPMHDQAMRFLNLVANKLFGNIFSWLLGQAIKDTLCGTKVLWRDDWRRILEGRSYFGDFDPFGDFDLLFGGARLGLKIVDLPVRYSERTYGRTNIHRFRHGLLLFRMVGVAARRLKFT
jgi:SAM-dependent methyltransferase